MNIADSQLQEIQIEVRRLNDVKMLAEKSVKNAEKEKKSIVLSISRLKKTEEGLQESCVLLRKELTGMEKQKTMIVGSIVIEKNKIEEKSNEVYRNSHILELLKKQLEEEARVLNVLDMEYQKNRQSLSERELLLDKKISEMDGMRSSLVEKQKKIDSDLEKIQTLVKSNDQILKDIRLEGIKQKQIKLENENAHSLSIDRLSEANKKLKLSEENLNYSQQILAEIKKRELALEENTLKDQRRIDLLSASIDQKRKELELDQMRVTKIIREKDIERELREFKEKYGTANS